MKHYLKTSPKQMMRSSYMGFFQLPLLPEKLLSLFDYKLLIRSMLRSSQNGTCSAKDMLRYKEAWKQPGVLKAILNWYRAALKGTLELGQKVVVPTMLIWGKQDQFLSHEMAEPSIKQCLDGRLIGEFLV